MSFDQTWEEIHSGNHPGWPDKWGITPDPRVLEFANKLKPRSKILDLGTGRGAQAFGMAELGFVVEGIDGSESGIRDCIDRKTSEDLNFIVGDVVSLPYKENSFDAAVECVVFQHLSSFYEFEKAVMEVLRVLKPGGRLFSLTAADDYDVSIPSPPVITATETEIKMLYSSFTDLSYSKTSHISTRYGRIVSWWQIEARKPLANGFNG